MMLNQSLIKALDLIADGNPSNEELMKDKDVFDTYTFLTTLPIAQDEIIAALYAVKIHQEQVIQKNSKP